MTIIITGIAGFVGFNIASYLKKHYQNINLIGIDNLSRRGSEYNLPLLKELGVPVIHGDIRNKEDIEDLPKSDWIIDCAANPSVLAGLEGGSLALINNNLISTINLLDKCRKDNSGFIMLSTSRVYSIDELNKLPLTETEKSFTIQKNVNYPLGFSELGVAERFSTSPPISLYGATKLASEVLALEYYFAFGFPVWINRCGVIAGPGQFGKIDQGIFSFWIYQYFLGNSLAYIGFGGKGKQVRDLFHPYDLFRMIQMQIENPEKKVDKIINLGGGVKNAYSLAQLNDFCKNHIKKEKNIISNAVGRSFDIPHYISDYSLAFKDWAWEPSFRGEDILYKIVDYAKNNLSLIRNL